MAYHDELLQRDEAAQTQARLRQAISTAYCAPFQLISESSRRTLGRMFEHGLKRQVSLRLVDSRSVLLPINPRD